MSDETYILFFKNTLLERTLQKCSSSQQRTGLLGRSWLYKLTAVLSWETSSQRGASTIQTHRHACVHTRVHTHPATQPALPGTMGMPWLACVLPGSLGMISYLSFLNLQHPYGTELVLFYRLRDSEPVSPMD